MIGSCLTWLLNKAVLSGYVHYYILEGYPHNKLSEYVHYYISEGCLHNKLSEYIHYYIYQRVVHKVNYWSMSTN